MGSSVAYLIPMPLLFMFCQQLLCRHDLHKYFSYLQMYQAYLVENQHDCGCRLAVG